ncbi:MAG: FliH/SctL family protein [Pseudomonadales bacterium]
MSLSIDYPPDLALSSLLEDTRVIPAEQYSDLYHIARGAQEAEQRIHQAEQHCLSHLDSVRQQAWDKGYQSGLAAASEKALTVLQRADQRSTKCETQLVDLALETVRALVGELPADVVTLGLAFQALRKVCEQHASVVVQVHPDSSATLQQRLQEKGVSACRGVHIEVQADPSMDRLDCRLETELGSVQAGLETQLAAIERALKSELTDG